MVEEPFNLATEGSDHRQVVTASSVVMPSECQLRCGLPSKINAQTHDTVCF
jgi:hypothetical protein